MIIPIDDFIIPKDFGVFGFDALMVEGVHANRLETSQMLEVAPELVRMDEAVTEFPKKISKMPTDAYALYWSTMKSQKQVSQSGVVGDPTKATKEFGKEVVDYIVNNIIRLMDIFEDSD